MKFRIIEKIFYSENNIVYYSFIVQSRYNWFPFWSNVKYTEPGSSFHTMHQAMKYVDEEKRKIEENKHKHMIKKIHHV